MAARRVQSLRGLQLYSHEFKQAIGYIYIYVNQPFLIKKRSPVNFITISWLTLFSRVSKLSQWCILVAILEQRRFYNVRIGNMSTLIDLLLQEFVFSSIKSNKFKAPLKASSVFFSLQCEPFKRSKKRIPSGGQFIFTTAVYSWRLPKKLEWRRYTRL